MNLRQNHRSRLYRAPLGMSIPFIRGTGQQHLLFSTKNGKFLFSGAFEKFTAKEDGFSNFSLFKRKVSKEVNNLAG